MAPYERAPKRALSRHPPRGKWIGLSCWRHKVLALPSPRDPALSTLICPTSVTSDASAVSGRYLATSCMLSAMGAAECLGRTEWGFDVSHCLLCPRLFGNLGIVSFVCFYLYCAQCSTCEPCDY